MIRLEEVHQEMNSKIVRDAADAAFDRWHLDQRSPKSATELKRLIQAAFRSMQVASTKHQKLAVEALLLIKLDNLMKEQKTLADGDEIYQCDICSRYYLSEALGQCDSCDSVICIECVKLDKDFDLTFCSGCCSRDLFDEK